PRDGLRARGRGPRGDDGRRADHRGGDARALLRRARAPPDEALPLEDPVRKSLAWLGILLTWLTNGTDAEAATRCDGGGRSPPSHAAAPRPRAPPREDRRRLAAPGRSARLDQVRAGRHR